MTVSHAGTPAEVSKRRPRHFGNYWKIFLRRVRAARCVGLFLDFDGTLAPLRSHPDEVRLPPLTRRALARLAHHPRVRIFLISGRRWADVRKRVQVRGVTYLGLHGWDRGKGRPGSIALHRFIKRLRDELEPKLSNLEGVWVEDKYVGFVVHCRNAPAYARRRALAALRQTLAAVPSRIQVLAGKDVREILPVEVGGKGAAVRSLLRKLNANVLPVYIGDDLSDEAGFEALPRGITIRVGWPRRTKARYFLRDPDEVREFLEKLEMEIS